MRLGSENDIIVGDKLTPNRDLLVALDTDVGQFDAHIDRSDAARFIEQLKRLFDL